MEDSGGGQKVGLMTNIDGGAHIHISNGFWEVGSQRMVLRYSSLCARAAGYLVVAGTRWWMVKGVGGLSLWPVSIALWIP